MHISKPKCYAVVGFDFKGVKGQQYVGVGLLMHILKFKCFILFGFYFEKSNVR